MNWSFKKPAVTGFYWICRGENGTPDIADIQILNGIAYYMSPTSLYEIDSMEMLFAGPLIPPEIKK